MTSQLSRIQILDAPMAAPGHCAICGGSVGQMVDFGMNVEFYGVIYFCVENCMVELANAFEYHSPRQWKMMMNQIEDQRNELNALRDRNEALENAMAASDRLHSFITPSRTPEFVMDLEPEEKRDEPEQLSFDFTDGKDTAPKQDDERGSTDIFRDDSLDGLLFDDI